MTELAWQTLWQATRDGDAEDWFLAEMEERIRLGDSLLVSGIPPFGEQRVFRDAEAFHSWYESVRLAGAGAPQALAGRAGGAPSGK